MSVKKCSVCDTSWPGAEVDDLGRCHNCRGQDQQPQPESVNEDPRHCPICKTILPEDELTSFDICRKCRAENGKPLKDVKEKKSKQGKQLSLNL